MLTRLGPEGWRGRGHQDMRLQEERLEQVAFREVLRLRAELLTKNEEDPVVDKPARTCRCPRRVASSSDGRPLSDVGGALLPAAWVCCPALEMTPRQQEVADWLASLGLEVYTRKFIEQVGRAFLWGAPLTGKS